MYGIAATDLPAKYVWKYSCGSYGLTERELPTSETSMGPVYALRRGTEVTRGSDRGNI